MPTFLKVAIEMDFQLKVIIRKLKFFDNQVTKCLNYEHIITISRDPEDSCPILHPKSIEFETRAGQNQMFNSSPPQNS